MTPAERTSEWIRGFHKQLAEQMNALAMRITTWLMVGNAAALVLIFKTILEDPASNRSSLTTAAWYFVAGLTTAFLGAAANYLTSLAGLTLVGKLSGLIERLAVNEYYISKLESEGIEVPDDAPLQTGITQSQEELEKYERWLPRLWLVFWAVVILYLASAAFFAAGIIVPLSNEVAVLSPSAPA